MASPHELVDPASFRDPAGFVFRQNGIIYRQVNEEYAKNYELLMGSGLYQELVEAGFLIPHQETSLPELGAFGYKILQPELIPFISYPYEWCFSQLKAAALLTLSIQKQALAKGMSLKDASAYNTQFRGFQPLLIDTLSFEAYKEGRPWVAYRQFCQHFLAPLALMSRVDLRLINLLRPNLDGIPLDLATKLLPKRTRLSPGLAAHLHLHASSQTRYGSDQRPPSAYRLSRTGLLGLLENLEKTVKGLTFPGQETTWGGYYEKTNYGQKATAAKKEIIEKWLQQAKPNRLLDLGANTGEFSQLASSAQLVLSVDSDPVAVERNYRQAVDQKAEHLLPLLIDLSNPSPAIGWENQERPAFFSRVSVDVVLCLALIHHLVIGNNLPLPRLARWLAGLAPTLIIEFIPKTDSNLQKLLVTRENTFPQYSEKDFEAAFADFFLIKEKKGIEGSDRQLYFMQRKEK